MITGTSSPVEPVCRHLPRAPQTYYAAKGRPRSKRALSNEIMTEKIHAIHKVNYGVYGVRKVHAELRRNGDSRGLSSMDDGSSTSQSVPIGDA